MIIDSPNWVQDSQGKVRDTQTETGKDFVDPKLLCDQSGRHFGLSFPSSVAVFENLCTKMISLSMFYHIILRRSLLRQFKSLVCQYNYYAYFYTKVRESKIAWFWKKQRLQSRSVWSGIKLIKCPNPYMVINNILIVYKGSFFWWSSILWSFYTISTSNCVRGSKQKIYSIQCRRERWNHFQFREALKKTFFLLQMSHFGGGAGFGAGPSPKKTIASKSFLSYFKHF